MKKNNKNEEQSIEIQKKKIEERRNNERVFK